VRLRPRAVSEQSEAEREAELRRGIARVETLLREGRSEREIVRQIRDQFAA
jgi:ribosomal protein L29